MNNVEFKLNRVLLGLTQEQLGEALGIHEKSVARIEAGNANVSKRLAKAFELLIESRS